MRDKKLNTKNDIENYKKSKFTKENIMHKIANNSKIRFAAVFGLVLLAYGMYMIIATFMINKERTIVNYGTIESMENVKGYVFRDEIVVEADSSKSIKPIIKEGERTKKGDEISTYYESDYATYEQKIKELDVKINDAMANKPDIFSNDVKIIEEQILSLVTTSQGMVSIDDMVTTKAKVNELVQKKAKIVGDLSPAGSHIKSLIEERSKIEQQANNSMQTISASRSGIVSYYIDGLENIFTVSKLEQYTVKELEDYVKSSKESKEKQSGVRIVDNFKSYILVPYDSQKAKNIELNKKIYLRFPDQSTEIIPATIIAKKDDDNKVILVIEVKDSLEYITNYRDINFELVWWQYEGMRIPKQAVYKENEDTFINILKYGENKKIQIKVLKENDLFYIIDNITYDEWIAKGISPKDASNKDTVMLYDEIIVNK